MTDVERNALDAIVRLCDQMSYTAMMGHVETLKAQFDTLHKQTAKLEVALQYTGR